MANEACANCDHKKDRHLLYAGSKCLYMHCRCKFYVHPRPRKELEVFDHMQEQVINAVAQRIHETAKVKGWWDEPVRTFGDMIALIHSEASEALEQFRNGEPAHNTWYSGGGKPEGVPSELADIVIRVLDMASYYGIDIGKVILKKMEYNEGREHRHGGKKL